MATKVELAEKLTAAGIVLTGEESHKELTDLVKDLPEQEGGAFHVHAELNDKVFDIDTDDLRETILSLKPEFLKTSLKLRISKGDLLRDRFLYCGKAKILFNNKYTLDAFIKGLYL